MQKNKNTAKVKELKTVVARASAGEARTMARGSESLQARRMNIITTVVRHSVRMYLWREGVMATV